MDATLNRLTHILLNTKIKKQVPGAINEKVGLAVYMYTLIRKFDVSLKEQIADEVLDDVYQNLTNDKVPIGFLRGLTGIGWAFEYLVQNNFVDGATDDILTEIDDKLFRFMTSEERPALHMHSGVLGFAAYTIMRLKNPTTCSANRINFERFLIDLVNQISWYVDQQKIQINDPAKFDLLWDLPMTIIILCEIYSMGLYQMKIQKLLEYLFVDLISFIPTMHSNRVMILISVERAIALGIFERGKEYEKIIKENIDFLTILSEFKDNEIILGNGLAGVIFAIEKLLRLNSKHVKNYHANLWKKRLEKYLIDTENQIEDTSMINIDQLNCMVGANLLIYCF